MSLLPWRAKLTPELLAQVEGSPDRVAVLIQVIPSVMVAIEDTLRRKYRIDVKRRILTTGHISALVEREYIAEIAKMPQVISVTHIPTVGLLPEVTPTVIPTLPYMRVAPADVATTLPAVADFLGVTPLKQRGFTGRGVRVAIVDSGVAVHPMLEGRVAREIHFIGSSPRDVLGHGTHVAGIAVGNRVDTSFGVAEGLAPDAQLVNVKIFETGETTADICMQGLEYAAMNGASIINCSWGASQHFAPFHELIRALRARYGCTFVCAAGNGGPDAETIVCPADSLDVVAAGSVSIVTGGVSEFSSRGPTYAGQVKPDLVGCGEAVISAYLGGSYAPLSGTSMATPTIAGGLACLVRNMASSVYAHASRATAKDNAYGYGIPNFAASLGDTVARLAPQALIMNLGPLLGGIALLRLFG